MMTPKRSPAMAVRLFLALICGALLPACGGGSSDDGPVTPAPVTSTNPSDDATNVPTSTNGSTGVTGRQVTATFSQPMDPATLNSSPAGTLLTFTLRVTGGADVPGTVAMNAANTKATFTPTASALLVNTSYTATVTTAAKTAGGVAIPYAVSWNFTTTATVRTGQAPVDLGMAGDYTIFANTGIANAVIPASITGDMGVGQGVTSTAITGFALILPAASPFSTSAQVSGKVYAFDYAPPTPTNVTTASSNMGAAYDDAAGRLLPDFTNFNAGNLGSQTLTPGLYSWGTAVTLPIGTNVTISGTADDVWIFQIAGTLETAASTNVFLSGGAQAKNIFWQVAGATVTLGTSAHFEGIVLAKFAINFENQASANSRLLAQTRVDLSQNAVTAP